MDPLRVLIVDDDAIINLLLAQMLGGLGHICTTEASEADAVTAAIRCRPDVMIIDVQLGDGSGISAVDAILRTGPLAHVFVSGDISRIRNLRPNSVALQKPFRELDLSRAIQRALGSPSRRAEQNGAVAVSSI